MSLKCHMRLKILFLATWYPSRIHPLAGIFIKRQVESVSKYCDASVLYVDMDRHMHRLFDIDIHWENDILTVRVYFKKFKVPLISTILFFSFYIISCYIGLKEIKKRFGRPHIIHVNVVFPIGIIAILLKYIKGIPFIVTEHFGRPSLGFLRGYEKWNRFYPISNFIMNRANCVVVSSTAMKDAISKLGCKRNIYVIPNAIDFMPDLRFKRRCNKIAILHVSLMDDRIKDISGIIMAVSTIYNKRKDFELHIVGDGKDRKKLEDMANLLGLLNKCVYFHGMVSEERKMELFSQSDFFILNSRYEGFSVVTAEAIACGIPVIATRSGGPEDFVTKEVGTLIEPDNQEQLENAIIYMLDNCHKYDRAKLVEYARGKFSYDVVGRQFYNLYRTALTRWGMGYSGYKVYIHPNWYVLDVGSGHNPHPRADVCLEKTLEESPHRSFRKAVIPHGKCFVIGDGMAMPFKDKVFNFVIASHVLEHIKAPEVFLNELQRVGHHGYIETPGILTETLLTGPSHIWIISRVKDILVIKKKKRQKPLYEPFRAFFYINEPVEFRTYHTHNLIIKIIVKGIRSIWKFIPFTYVRYHWDEKIKYIFHGGINEDRDNN